MELELRKGNKLLTGPVKVCNWKLCSDHMFADTLKTPEVKGKREGWKEQTQIKNGFPSSYLFNFYLDSIEHLNSLPKELCFA